MRDAKRSILRRVISLAAPSAGNVSGNKVVEEYRVHGYEIFSWGNKVLESTIKANCSNLSELVKTGAKAWYTPTGKILQLTAAELHRVGLIS
jgi:hypothetical protein